MKLNLNKNPRQRFNIIVNGININHVNIKPSTKNYKKILGKNQRQRRSFNRIHLECKVIKFLN